MTWHRSGVRQCLSPKARDRDGGQAQATRRRAWRPTDVIASSRLLAIALSVAMVAGLAGVSSSAAAAPAPTASSGPAGPSLLGLPPLSAASRYVEAPSSRVVRPVSVVESTPVNDDFVTAGSLDPSVTIAGQSPTNAGPSASEAAHDFQAGPHATRVRLMGVGMQEAGPGVPRAFFSLRLHVPAGGPVRIRVEDAASATADYWVLVDGVRVFHRTPQVSQEGLVSESGPQFKGLVHYSFAVPASVLAAAPRSGTGRVLTVEFRNSLNPGPGARIARVWAISPGNAAPASPYGGTVVDPTGAISGPGTTLTSATYGRPFVIYDFGKDVGGRVSFDVSGVTKPVTVGLAFSESSEYMTSASDQACGTSGVCTETHYLTVQPGQSVVNDPNLRGGFRYLMVFLDTPGSIRISDLRVNFTPDPGVANPAAYSGAFLSASNLLNRIWYAGAYTAEMDTINPTTGRPYPATPGPLAFDATVASGTTAIVDGAKRDRLDWAGDQSVEDPTALLSNPGGPSAGEALAAENSFAFLASHAFPDGEIPGVYLTKTLGFQSAWGVYSLLAILNYNDIYLYTGDRAFLAKWWPTIQRDLAWAQGLVGSDGLIDVPGQFSGSWGYGASGHVAYVNAVYVLALRDMAKIATLEGDASLAATYTTEASSVAAAINAELWNASAGAYQVSISDSAIPQDANAMALVAGVATGARAASVLRYLNGPMATKYGTETINVANNVVGQYVSPFITYDQLLGELEQNSTSTTDAALASLERTWGYMLDSPLGTNSTFWEAVSLHGNPEMGAYTSLSHGWASGPVSLLSNEVLGVTPTGGGLSSFTVLPHPPSTLPWAEGEIPTPSGAVEAAWRQSAKGSRFELEASAAKGEAYTAGVPVMASGEAVWANGKLIWSGTKAVVPGAVEKDGYVELSGQSGTTRLVEVACSAAGCPSAPPAFGPATPLAVSPSGPPAVRPSAPAGSGGSDATGFPSAAGSHPAPPHPVTAASYNLSPSSRSLAPTSLYEVLPRGGSVSNAAGLVRPDGKPTVISLSSGDQTSSPLVILDMGKEVGGLVSVTVSGVSSPAPTLQACFSESTAYMALQPYQNDGESNYAPGCDSANIFNGLPGVPYTWDSDSHVIPVVASKVPGTFTDSQIRGGFRYLTLYLSSPGSISISRVRVDFTAAPNQANLRDYAGSFLSSSNTLNKLWYSGAYTVQLDTAAANTLKSWPYTTGEPDHADSEMPNTTPGETVILDGAKRDRDVWEGDLSVEGPVTALTTGDLAAWRSSLEAMGAQQVSDGYVPAEGLVGPHNYGEEFNYGTYVLWFVNNVYQYWLYTGDRSFLDKELPRASAAEAYVTKQVDSTGLLTFANTGIRGTGPDADPGDGACGTYAYYLCGHLTYINALYDLTLREMASLATVAGQTTPARTYATEAAALKKTINATLWNANVGAYELSPSHANVFPEDAQAMAVLAGVASPSQAARALSYLRSNTWETFGSELTSPTGSSGGLPPGYEPLAQGYELLARYAASTSSIADATAEQLMQRGWLHMLDASYGPQSTFWEKENQEGLPGIAQFTSLAHGWAAMPTVALTTDVLGVRPTSGGFATYAVEPHPGTLRWAKGTVPTPNGAIELSWRRVGSGGFTVRLTSPAHTSGAVAVPTFGRRVQVRIGGTQVWNGTSGVGGAHLAGDYVVIPAVGSGSHVITSTPISPPTTALSVVVSPGVQSTTAGDSGVLRVTVYADGPGTVSGTLAVTGPAGWQVGPATQHFTVASDGAPAHERLYAYYLHVPSGSAGDYSIIVVATTTSGVSAQATAELHATETRTLYDFADASTQGWTAGPGVASVGVVQSFANGPGHCAPGPYCLAAISEAVAGDSPRVVEVTPSTPLDLAAATSLVVYLDAYGGAPGRKGYEATVTLVSGTHTLVSSEPVSANTWNEVTAKLGSWPYADDVTQLQVAFNATGTTQLWAPEYQIGAVDAVES